MEKIKFNEEGCPICPICGGLVTNDCEQLEINGERDAMHVDFAATCEKCGQEYNYCMKYKPSEIIEWYEM